MLPPFNKRTCRGKWTLQERWDRTEIEGREINTAPITWRGIHPETTRRRELVQFITSSRQKAILRKRSNLELFSFLLNHHNTHLRWPVLLSNININVFVVNCISWPLISSAVLTVQTAPQRPVPTARPGQPGRRQQWLVGLQWPGSPGVEGSRPVSGPWIQNSWVERPGKSWR